MIKAQSIAHNRPYDMDLIDWIKAAFNVHIGNEQNKKDFGVLHYVPSFMYN